MQYQAMQPKNMTYRFNWNAPIAYSKHEKNVFYHAGNRLFRTRDMGKSWEVISPDLTTHDTTKMGISGYPYTNEGAGGENYCTIAYFMESDKEKGVMYTGSDDGLVHVTKDDGKTWTNITPVDLGEALINAIEVSPHDPATVYIAATKYKLNDFTPFAYKSNDYGKTWTKIVNGLPYGACVRVVREDNVRKNLLFAGTEVGLFASYDGGNTWNKFQRNLPVTPITDLKIHQNNLIASTQGRAFWILDELQPVRAYDGQQTMKLISTPEAFRISGYSIFDSNDDDTTQKYPVTTGANPSTGAVIYYQLPSDSVKSLTLQVKDNKGNVVRSFSNKAIHVPATNNSMKDEPVLTAKKGLNRFVWNLRRPEMPTIDNVYIEGNYNGGKIVPGDYTLSINADGVEKTAPLKVNADPRLQFSNDEYAAQDDLLKKLEKDMTDIHVAVNRMNALSKQIDALNKLIENDESKKALVQTGKSIIEKIKDWEGKLIQPKAQSYDDIINFVNKLSANIIFVHGELSATVPHVTAGQVKRYNDLHAEWLVYEKQMKDLLSNEVASYNQMCRNMGVNNVILPD
jgi:photosystem II stability/assembly factor-like uncharacterized protein